MKLTRTFSHEGNTRHVLIVSTAAFLSICETRYSSRCETDKNIWTLKPFACIEDNLNVTIVGFVFVTTGCIEYVLEGTCAERPCLFHNDPMN